MAERIEFEMKKKYLESGSPLANESAIVKGDKFRITVLTSRLLRIEYSENGIFNDSATFAVINRDFEVPKYEIKNEDGILLITTEYIRFQYNTTKPFSKESMSLRYIGNNASVSAGRALPTWHFGIDINDNLLGTASSMDRADGECHIDDGIMSTGGVCVLDDSKPFLLNEDGSISASKKKSIDQYLFCYGCAGEKKYDYITALRDFYKLSGNTPLLPKYVLGNWWSRYHEYTQDEYIKLIERFSNENIPLSVAMLDMDWHLAKIDTKYGGGWTGYTWNEELFPNHKEFLSDLHKKGLHIGLNIHPQGGIAAHEKCYNDMADAMGIDKSKEELVEFDIENTEFVENYFKVMHNPLEEEGVDFWWIDYNTKERMLAVDPLPMLNHYHYQDMVGRTERPLILSRYSGPGSHRYPIGFSGDTISTWETLEFQTYFTIVATNIGYGWWSHDIGGFIFGIKDDELMARWTQFGVFSPITRLHSTNSRFMSKEPWLYNKTCEISMKKFLRLRHKLMPYLYTMNYLAANEGIPIVRPLYYYFSYEESYMHKSEYMFGSEMLVSAIVKPADSATTMGAASVFLPEGIWYDFFSGRTYNGGKTFTAFRDIYTMPVFVKAGGIIPMTDEITSLENPENLSVNVYAGASNKFDMYEDDGISYNYDKGEYVITHFDFNWGDKAELCVSKAYSAENIVPYKRNYTMNFVGVCDTDITVFVENEEVVALEKSYKNRILTVKISGVINSFKVILSNANLCSNSVNEWLEEFLQQANIEYELKDNLYNVLTSDVSIEKKFVYLQQNVRDENVKSALTEIITQEI